MATNLTGSTIASTYEQLLHMDGGPEATEKIVYSGTGTATALKLGTQSVSVDNLKIDGNTLSSTNTDGDINITPNGTGGVVIPTLFATSLGVNGTLTGTVAGVAITSQFCVKSDGTNIPAGFVHANNTTASSGSIVYACRSRGTIAAPTIVQDDDSLASFIVAGYDGTDLALAARIDFEVDGTPGSNDMPTRMIFKTTPDASQIPAEALRIDSSQNVLVTGSGGLGYGTGSGGTVTQATSRTTGVTLNKTTGAITLVSDAGSSSWQTFTVTNSAVAATDTIVVNQKSGTDLYMIHVTAVAAGSFDISFATTGGTTTEQPVLNFVVIKGVSA
jgi:hypothetical protein